MTDVEGKTICFTGKLNSFTRNQARVMALGAKMRIADAVSRGLDYLVMADKNSTSTKARKARSYGTTLLSEDDFLEMVGLDESSAKAEAEKMNAPKKVLDWKTCFDVIAKKLGITSSKKSEPVYWRGRDEKRVNVKMWLGREVYLGCSNDMIRLPEYGGKKLEWTDDDMYDMSDDDAYRKAVWLIGTKTFRKNVVTFDWLREDAADKKTLALMSSYPEFGMPGSTEELKLKLEVLDWSIL